MTRILLLVALGGALGSVARAGVGLWTPWPWGTLAVNVAGGLLMGLLFARLGAGTPRLVVPDDRRAWAASPPSRPSRSTRCA